MTTPSIAELPRRPRPTPARTPAVAPPRARLLAEVADHLAEAAAERLQHRARAHEEADRTTPIAAFGPPPTSQPVTVRSEQNRAVRRLPTIAMAARPAPGSSVGSPCMLAADRPTTATTPTRLTIAAFQVALVALQRGRRRRIAARGLAPRMDGVTVPVVRAATAAVGPDDRC